MKRKFTSYPVHNFSEVKIQMLSWLKQFSIFCFLDNNIYNFSPPSFECLLGVDAINKLTAPAHGAFEALQNFKEENEDWLLGHLAYDLKNEIEHLSSANTDRIKFPDIFFFVPRILLLLNKHELKIGIVEGNADKIFEEISSLQKNPAPKNTKTYEIKSRYTRDEYLLCIEQLHKHILRGDCYEINFCQEFFVDNAVIDPFLVYDKLTGLSPNPFSAFYRVDHNYLLCASPERYLKKVKNTIYSQPIKGTSKRDLSNSSDDESNKKKLLNSDKERAENVMIVDLVRNDLSRVCIEGSVKVEELFEIYSFPQVHQMVSTVSGVLKKESNICEILKATFPMGSMTGAPKKKVMELIELYERTKRGIFSGALGYITPGCDFDFNVVIRSIAYNSADNYLSLSAGSAITFNSDPQKEYEECLVKIEALKKALQ